MSRKQNRERAKQKVRERCTQVIGGKGSSSCCALQNSSSMNAVKSSVRKTYAELISQKKPSWCCGPQKEDIEEKVKEELVAMAGYSQEDLKRLPQDVVENAFGCGNPVALAHLKRGDVVLDIGSGAGIDCLLAAEKVGPQGRVIGLDMTPEMIERARENAKKAGVSNVEFRLGDAEDMPVEDNSVDWVISNCVINLAPNKDKVFKEIYRVLKPGGKVSISDIVSENLPQEIRTNMKAWASCIGGTISEEEYLNKMKRAGLTDVKVISRFVYDQSQISAFVETGGTKIGLSPEDISLYHCIKDQIVGKIWSAKFSAKKPPRS